MAKSRACKGCGKFFTPGRKGQVYHSEECRNEDYARLYPNYAKIEVFLICPKCGNEFLTTKPLRQAYCTPECREEGGENPYQDVADKSKQVFLDAHPERFPGYSKLNRRKALVVTV